MAFGIYLVVALFGLMFMAFSLLGFNAKAK